jgi:L-asparaginase
MHAVLAAPNAPAGVVITHGTATLEETAYFLHLTVKSDRPVVITGAMRPPSALGTDADLNLLDAIRLAAAPEAAGRGVLTILNNEIQSARDVTKSNAFRVDTFGSRDFGVLGYVDADARVLFYRTVTRPHTTATPFDVRRRKDLPRVDILYSYAGADGVLVDALTARRPDGMVLVGFGGGSYPAAFLEAGKRAVQAGIPVVLATRSWSGRVVTTPKKDADGFIVCDDLMPQKARILLMLALTVTHERQAIQEMFYRF